MERQPLNLQRQYCLTTTYPHCGFVTTRFAGDHGPRYLLCTCKELTLVGSCMHITNGVCQVTSQYATSALVLTLGKSSPLALLGTHFSKLYYDIYLALAYSPITVSIFKHGIHNSQAESIYQLP